MAGADMSVRLRVARKSAASDMVIVIAASDEIITVGCTD